MRIGIDLMGSDQPPQALLEAVYQLVETHPSHQFVVLGNSLNVKDLHGITYVQCAQTIEMDDSPLEAVRRKKDSSMATGMRLLKEHKIDALVSAGNTGALVALARLNLPLLPTITSLSLLVLLPKEKGKVAVLDVGANISFKPHHLVEYAKLGQLYFQIVHGLENPLVGLLNIGVEEKKGTAVIKEGYQILNEHFQKTPDVFLGNIEGKKAFQQGAPDVLITDGFTGNVFLKTCEGVFSFLLDFFKKQLEGKESFDKLLLSFHKQFKYSAGGGALLCGIDGIVIKCHGDSSPAAFAKGIKDAIDLAEKEIIKKMKKGLDHAT